MTASVVATTSGRYRGVQVDGVHAFLGVRYGAGVGGARRFLPALPAPPHAGIVDALAHGPAALQFDGRLLPGATSSVAASLYFPSGAQTEGAPMGEECLNLHVWTPSVDPGSRLPVIVWIHGGAYRAGSAAAVATRGARLAARGRAVVVAVNHRLGIPGFLALDHLLGEEYAGSGSAGIDDIVLALAWVRDNAGAFGGDPGAVTLAGQSGGGGKVLAVLSSPSARGLVHRAIVQSGADRFLDPEAGRVQTGRVLAHAGLAAADARRLLELTPEELVAAQGGLSTEGLGPWPVADGTLLDPERRDEHSADIPLLVGHTSHDWSFFLADAPWYAALDDADLPAALTRVLPGADPDLLERARAEHPSESAPLLLSRLAAERSFGAAAARAAETRAAAGSPVHRYEFAVETDAGPVPLGATHCLEIPYVFGTGDVVPLTGSSPHRSRLTDEVAEAWLSFAESGTPTAAGGVAWETFRSGATTTMRIGEEGWEPTRSTASADLTPELL